MQAPWWFVVLGFAEGIFVTCVFFSELTLFAFRRQIFRLDRAMHSIPDDRYFSVVFLPVVSVLVGVSGGIGVNLMTGDDELAGYVGMLLVMACVVALMWCLLRYAMGSGLRGTRPPFRVRQELVRIRGSLDPDGPVTHDRAARIRVQLTRLRRTGDRLVERAGKGTWRDAVRNERRWLVAALVIAFLLPLVGAARIALRLVQGHVRTEAVPSLAILLGLSTAIAVGAVMRRIRHRLDQKELGTELRSESEALLARLAKVAPMHVPQPARSSESVVRALWDRLTRSRTG